MDRETCPRRRHEEFGFNAQSLHRSVHRVSDTFDYVIVGAGAAGAILAHRLSVSGQHSVCVLEAGPRDWHPYLHLPAGFIKVVFNPAPTWPLTSEPSSETLNRRVALPQGRVLGGSTSINGLVYNRGQREDFDEWAALGNPGWSYEEVLPFFKRNEQRLAQVDTRYRGDQGLLPASDCDWRHPICERFIARAQALGMPRNPDYNGETQAGVGYFQRSIRGRWRMSTANTYLRAARAHAQLDIRTNAQALAVELNGTRASGVRYVRDRSTSSPRIVHARREVVLCAGALQTPKLLQLSGVGHAPLLQSLGIPVRHALAGVGANLSDHYSVRVVAGIKDCVTINELSRAPRLWGEIARWIAGRPSVLTLSPSVVHWFWQSRPGLTRPDLQGVFSPASYREGYVGVLDRFPGMSAGVWAHRPYSRGTVQARSLNALDDPLIQPNYLSDPRDGETLVAGIRLARRLLATSELAALVTGETHPGPQVQIDDELLDFARRFGVSSYHLNGTARMGRAEGPGAVVDAQLRVHGVQNLRVVDASVMPTITSANTAAATMMIAEKAAQMIQGSR